MEARDLNPSEVLVLVGLAAYVACVDGEIEPGEREELVRLEQDLGLPSLKREMSETLAAYPTFDTMLERAGRVYRPEARELIRTILHDLAQSSGTRDQVERTLLARLDEVWR